MGVVKPKYTVPLPENAVVRGNSVAWTDTRGTRKKGKLTKNGRVQVEADTWQIRYRDEHNRECRESTKLTNREAAQKLLMLRQSEVERIVLGVATREEIGRADKKSEPMDTQLDIFGKKQYAGGSGDDHIEDTRRKIETARDEIGFRSIRDITAEKVESWIADQRRSGRRSPRTINSYLVALNSFLNWAVDSGRLEKNPLKRRIKKLNESVDRRKDRRSLTEDELRRLFLAARTHKGRAHKKRGQTELVYRLLAGMGLRSTELSLAVPSQFDFQRNLFTVKASKTKNKKADVLPIRPDLAADLQRWIAENEVGPGDRIFKYNKHSIYKSFLSDLKLAGIKREGKDGRTIDVHCLRRTFGTMLAKAGVPLTTTQRLMRHSTPELTAKLYIDVEPIDMMKALEKLPMFDDRIT